MPRWSNHTGAVQRVAVIGNSGAGKTTLATALSERRNLPRLELDALYHQADWSPLDADTFRERVRDFCDGDSWVTDGNHSAVTPIIWARADTVVWLDYPRWRTTWRVLQRSIRRAARGIELWNGNHESWRNLLSLDRERNVVLSSITAHRAKREQYGRAMDDGTFGSARVLRFTTPRQCAVWLTTVEEDHHGH